MSVGGSHWNSIAQFWANDGPLREKLWILIVADTRQSGVPIIWPFSSLGPCSGELSVLEWKSRYSYFGMINLNNLVRLFPAVTTLLLFFWSTVNILNKANVLRHSPLLMINCLFILTVYILPASQILNQFQQVLILPFFLTVSFDYSSFP